MLHQATFGDFEFIGNFRYRHFGCTVKFNRIRVLLDAGRACPPGNIVIDTQPFTYLLSPGKNFLIMYSHEIGQCSTIQAEFAGHL